MLDILNLFNSKMSEPVDGIFHLFKKLKIVKIFYLEQEKVLVINMNHAAPLIRTCIPVYIGLAV